ncbi:golgin subfamily A member 6-like protein 22 [Macrobrachium rosenbergii]|uniref:golgin subfamily A member 6-like protein 22 n=1 Tax=Macrobrachium rosenbergii TaxID=79674 RepID=UPI0034D54D25
MSQPFGNILGTFITTLGGMFTWNQIECPEVCCRIGAPFAMVVVALAAVHFAWAGHKLIRWAAAPRKAAAEPTGDDGQNKTNLELKDILDRILKDMIILRKDHEDEKVVRRKLTMAFEKLAMKLAQRGTLDIENYCLNERQEKFNFSKKRTSSGGGKEKQNEIFAEKAEREEKERSDAEPNYENTFSRIWPKQNSGGHITKFEKLVSGLKDYVDRSVCDAGKTRNLDLCEDRCQQQDYRKEDTTKDRKFRRTPLPRSCVIPERERDARRWNTKARRNEPERRRRREKTPHLPRISLKVDPQRMANEQLQDKIGLQEAEAHLNRKVLEKERQENLRLQQIIDDLEKKNLSILRREDKMRDDNENLQLAIRSLKACLKEAECRNEKKDLAAEKLAERLKEAERENRELKRQQLDKEQATRKYQSEGIVLRRQIRQMGDQLERVQKENKTMKCDLQEIIELLRRKDQEKRKNEECLQKLKEEAVNQDGLINQLNRKIDQLGKHAAHTEKMNKNLRDENDKLRRQLEVVPGTTKEVQEESVRTDKNLRGLLSF